MTLKGLKVTVITLAWIGGVALSVLAIFLSQGFFGWGLGGRDGWMRLLPALVISGALAFVFLLLTLVFGMVFLMGRKYGLPGSRGLSPTLDPDAPVGQETEQAMSALLALQGPSYSTDRISPSIMRVQLHSVQSKNGRLMMPLTYNLELDINVQLDESGRKYYFRSTSYETNGLSMSTEMFSGVYRRRQRGKYLTLDGVVAVQFDTGQAFDRIEQVLQPLGWSRA